MLNKALSQLRQSTVSFCSTFLRQLSVGGLLAIIASVNVAFAADLQWDANTGTAGAQDGSGTWDTSNTNWLTATGTNGTNTNWVNGSNAFFGGNPFGFGLSSGTGGVVTLGT